MSSDGLTTCVVTSSFTGMNDSRPEPEGSLTRTQYEILRAIWAIGGDGATVAEIWREVSNTRSVARTTILNLVDRLERRRWLTHEVDGSVRRYRSATSRADTEQHLVDEVVTDFFEGSAVDLVSRLLGSDRLGAADRRRLAELIDEEGAKPAKSRKAGRPASSSKKSVKRRKSR